MATMALLAAVAVVFGAAVATAPMLAAGAVFALLVTLLAFVAPAVHLTLLLFVAAVVPYSIQNAAGGAAGLILVDVVLMTGLARAAVVLAQQPLDARRALAVVATLAVMLIAVLQFVHAIDAGRSAGDAGNELRSVLGLSALLIAIPVLADAAQRTQLFKGLIGVAIILGAWGIAQWVLAIPFGEAGDVGVRAGVSFTSNGRGQVQGGAYAFPIAVVLSFAALASGHVTSAVARAGLLLALSLNALSLVLTFERAFWIGTAMGVLVVIARTGHVQRLRALLWTPVAVLLVAGLFASVAPGQFTAANERLLSVREYNDDSSVSYRVIESQHVLTEIRKHPVVGSGLAATIWWGRPSEGVPPRIFVYSHNAYLWVLWKLGAVAAAILALLVALVLFRPSTGRDGLGESLRRGAQATILVQLVLGVTSPIFNTSATPLLGLLFALCLIPSHRRASPPADLPAGGRRSEPGRAGVLSSG